jgi:acyl-coenzyme A thioesterase PaaI-like protein
MKRAAHSWADLQATLRARTLAPNETAAPVRAEGSALARGRRTATACARLIDRERRLHPHGSTSRMRFDRQP